MFSWTELQKQINSYWWFKKLNLSLDPGQTLGPDRDHGWRQSPPKRLAKGCSFLVPLLLSPRSHPGTPRWRDKSCSVQKFALPSFIKALCERIPSHGDLHSMRFSSTRHYDSLYIDSGVPDKNVIHVPSCTCYWFPLWTSFCLKTCWWLSLKRKLARQSTCPRPCPCDFVRSKAFTHIANVSRCSPITRPQNLQLCLSYYFFTWALACKPVF